MQQQQQQPQHPGLTHLRKRLGLPLQQSLHKETVSQATDASGLWQQGYPTQDSLSAALPSRFATCKYEVSARFWLFCLTAVL